MTYHTVEVEEDGVSVWDGESYVWMTLDRAQRMKHFCIVHQLPHTHIDTPEKVIIGCAKCVGSRT